MDSFGPLLEGWRVDTTIDSNGYRHHKLQSGPECWKEVDKLGSGTYGVVYQELCLSGRSKNSMRAVKHVLKPQVLSEMRRELDALVTFSNSEFPEYREHFVQFRGWFDDARHLYITMEFFEHGDLHKHMSNHGTFPEIEAALITTQVAQALQYMHDKGFIHRDIKPSNILVFRPGPYWHVKVADFGAAKNTDGSIARSLAGTPGYMAPEARSLNSYTPAVDIWSLGAVAYYMRTGFAPSHLNNYAQDYDKNFPFRMLRNSGASCKDFVIHAMAEVPEQRLTIKQALAHGWLQIDYTQLGVPQRGEPTTNAKNEQTASTSSAKGTWSTERQSQPRMTSVSSIDPTLTPKPSVISPHLGQHRYGQENKYENKVGSVQRKEVSNNPGRIVAQSQATPMGTFGRHSEARTKKVEPKQSHVSQTLHKLADFTLIAQQFVDYYYQIFDNDPKGLRSLYRDQSMLTFETSSVQGVQSIIEKLSSLPFQKVKHQVATLDAQPSHGNGITVLLTGTLLVDEKQRPMAYTQLFELMPENGSYYVLNDVFRLLFAY